MKYILFVTLNLKTNRHLIGIHETENPEYFDGYIGEDINLFLPFTYKNSKTELQYEVNTYGTKNFKRIDLGVYDSKEVAEKVLDILLSSDKLQDTKSYNKAFEQKPFNDKKPIYMYDMEGKFIKSFDNPYECAKFLGDKTIHKVATATKLNRPYKDYQFSQENVQNTKKYKLRERIKIAQYDLEGNLIKVFDTITQAKQEFGQNVIRVIKGQYPSYKGYVFKKVNDIV